VEQRNAKKVLLGQSEGHMDQKEGRWCYVPSVDENVGFSDTFHT
jgi:hypothetical protein